MMQPSRELDKLIADKVMGRSPMQHVPYYSSNIGDAWDVVEKMRPVILKHEDIWLCNFYNNFEAFKGVSESAPMAICLAALKAIGYDLPTKSFTDPSAP